jgi:RNA polymerase sigma factor
MAALGYARENPALLAELEKTKKLPLTCLADGSGVSRKTLERHRKYLVAILLAYTNGYEIIRGHLRQMKGGTR